MSRPNLFYRRRTLLPLVHKVTSVVILAVLLAGLLPPPLMNNALNATLPTTLAQPLVNASQALLPAPKVAQAAAPAPVAQQKTFIANAPAAPAANPLNQGIAGSNTLTITKAVVGTGSGPFSLTVTGPDGYVNNTTLTPGTPVVLTGLASGVYTVTETSPGVSWATVYTATPGLGGSTHAVVALNDNSATFDPTPIMGTVYRDLDSDGQRLSYTAQGATIFDVGVSGVKVEAYDKDGKLVGSTITPVGGTYLINPTGPGPYRVEFSNLPSGYEPTTHAAFVDSYFNGTSTQFVTTPDEASEVNLGINYPCDYCQEKPLAAQPVWLNGDPALQGAANDYPWWVAFDYTRLAYASQGFPYTLKGAAMGTLWGETWQRTTKKLYASAVVRRHAGLGPLGLGGLYQIDLTSGTATIQPFADLAAAPFGINFGTLPSNTLRGLPADKVALSVDAAAFAAVGKQGIGGIALTEDESQLFVVNLNTRSLVALNVAGGATPTTSTTYPIAGAPGVPTCTNGQIRPWAIKFYRGRGYVGAVCDASAGGTNLDLTGYVLSFDAANPAAGFTRVLTIPFSYTRSISVPSALTVSWNPWVDVWNSADWRQGNNPLGDCPVVCVRPTPILMDLGFDTAGNLTLAVGDRTVLQLGALNEQPDGNTTLVGGHPYGDLLKACGNPTQGWKMESNGTCGTQKASRNQDYPYNLSPSQQGYSGLEFYQDDATGGDGIHFEALVGGLAMHLWRNETAYSAMDVLGVYDNGMARNRTADGYRLSWGSQTYFGGSNTSDPFGIPGYFGKAAGVGDLELLCDPAPLEIGNRVWHDINRNGRQDPGEPGISALTVSLQGPTNTITTTTDVNGNYYFNVNVKTAYTLTLTPPNGYSLTTPNATALAGTSPTSNTAISDTIDSDAVLVNGQATIYYTTGSAGQNNHGLDFGFFQPAGVTVAITNIAPVKIGNRLWIETDQDGDASTNLLQPVSGQVVTATSSSGLVYTATTDINGYYTMTVPANHTYTVQTSLPPGTLPSTVQSSGADDSNAALYDNRNHLYTGTVVTVANRDNLSVDFGFWLPQPSIVLKKYTNGYDADTITGPYIQAGEVVTWTYIMTNTGNVTLTNLTLTDDKILGLACFTLDLAPGESSSCTATDVATVGQYTNTATVTGTPTLGPMTPVTSTNPSHYFGVQPALVLKKYTNGYDADTLADDRPHLRLGDPVMWTYVITNTGNVTMSFAANSLKDDKEGTITHAAFTLLPGEHKTLTQSGTATTLGVYTNTASIPGIPVMPPPTTPDLPDFPPSNPPTTPITPTNPSHYDAVGLSLGNRLWVDDGAGNAANRDNGRYDNGEPAAPQGIVVELLNITGTVLFTTTTDANGYYRFDNLAVGGYQVRIPASEFAVGGKLYSYVSSTGQTTTADTAANGHDHGDDNPLDGVTSAVVTLGASNPTGEVDSGATGAGGNGPSGDANDNLSVDFSFVPLATFGNFVWIESDYDGIASTGVITPVGGMVITATGKTGTVYTTTTDSNGYYTFNVPIDVYTVTYGSVPSGYGVVVPSATPNSGTADKNNPGTDQQARPNGAIVTLVVGDNIPTIDFGFHTPRADLRLVKQADKTIVVQGDTVVYTLVLTNDGPDDMPSVKVTDRLPAAVAYQGSVPQQGTYDPTSGLWDVGTVPTNSSFTLTITVKVK